MIPSQLAPLANHLWQSTLFAALVGLLTICLRTNRARVRYWLWLAASVKLLIPFSILAAVGGLIGWHTATLPNPSTIVPAAKVSFVVRQFGEPFTIRIPQLAAQKSQRSNVIVTAYISVWALGFLVLLLRWIRRWRRLQQEICKASLLNLSIDLPVSSSPAFGEPALFGILQPILLLPAGLVDYLDAQEMEAIVAHELCHLRHRDNLVTAIHMAVEATFWFHPLVWWLGARLMEERERACDEAVLQGGREPGMYAESILKICELHLKSSLFCVAGVSGGNLKARIDAIVSHRVVMRLNLAKKAALTLIAGGTIAAPVIAGMIHAPGVLAQPQQNTASSAATTFAQFDVASIKPLPTHHLDFFQRQFEMNVSRVTAGHGKFDAQLTLEQLIRLAYNLGQFQVSGGPSWLTSDRYAVVAKVDTDATFEQMQPMLQSFLADRFKLSFHYETKQLPIYELGVASGGPKMMPAEKGSCVVVDPDSPPPPFDPDDPSSTYCKDDVRFDSAGMQIRVDQTTMQKLVAIISDDVRRIVVDRTGFRDRFNLRLKFAPSDALDLEGYRPSGPPMSAALREQLGLQLLPASAPVEVLTIDSLERPSEN
jgi:uncharacterized protein (TIGR03435 family)